MKTIRKPNGPQNVPVPQVWHVGDLLVREAPGTEPWFRQITEISGNQVRLQAVAGLVFWKGYAYTTYRTTQIKYRDWTLKEARERYMWLDPADYTIEEPF